MTIITIDTNNKEDLDKAKTIAKANGWVLKKIYYNSPINNGKKLSKLFAEFASKGGPTTFPANASAWQRNIRTDKKLAGRK